MRTERPSEAPANLTETPSRAIFPTIAPDPGIA
jgi:hypothetical protein